ncbi:SWPV2-ORF183 [Shearwaterpox virus]|uniref:SWPV2-ORF183 n=1 Tax=Shearwaterpox virus TaxID=1974596 RepID=A0A1V0QGE0_CNPV|nr:SWPV2-ORF183 [Shearwaterpox virus]QRI42914.1 hypothetical protein ChPV196 [Cheloniid poxvirus 1]QRM15471.1 hypothetical protein [Mudlarkpox virus]QRM15826.1 hypothetical protein [Penguinpox virus 2]QRM16161.1 hypothetical protein [Albatrosspox virus]
MDLNNTNQVIDCKEYIHNITNFITIKYNLYFMKHNIYNVIVKNRNESRAKKNAFNPYVVFYLIDDRNGNSERIYLYIGSTHMQVKDNNCMIMNPTTGELCHGENLLVKINSHIGTKCSITKYIVTSNEIRSVLETINLGKLQTT